MRFPALRLLCVLSLVACAGAPTPPTHTGSIARPPLTWQPWSRATFERAAREHKYLLLSVQTAWCHYCHVMNDVTYRDAEVLELLDRHFIAIRVDADARPDLAERYARWGWPATALLTPAAEPIFNLKGYREPREFARALRRVIATGAKAVDADAPRSGEDPAASDLATHLTAARAALAAMWDATQGGWGKPQKYPRGAPVEQAFLFAFAQQQPTARERALIALERYAQLLDPVWGGMFQYSVYGDWSHPHYEKIHAVQASALENFVHAYRATRDARWLDHARSIERYLRERLRAPEGAFYANQDADVGRPGDAFHQLGKDFYALSAEARERTRAPAIDAHVYASSNGMSIAALARLYEATRDPATLELAQTAVQVIERGHRRGAGYSHTARDGDPRVYLTDQTELARALLALYEVTGEPRYRNRLRELLGFALETLEDRSAGGFYAHSRDPEAAGALALPRKPITANARLARVLIWMSRITGERTWQAAAERTLRAISEPRLLHEDRRELGEYALALEELLHGYAVVTIVGELADPRAHALQRAALATYAPNRRVHFVDPNESDYPYPGSAVAYICTDGSCSLPIHRPEEIAPALQRGLTQP